MTVITEPFTAGRIEMFASIRPMMKKRFGHVPILLLSQLSHVAKLQTDRRLAIFQTNLS